MPLPAKFTRRTRGDVPCVRHEECWSKTTIDNLPGIGVLQHCRAAGVLAGLLAAQLPVWLRDLLGAEAGVCLTALHDIGKVSPGFQKKCPAWVLRHGLAVAAFAGMEEDHAKVSQKTLQDILLTDSADDALRLWAAIVGAHHGRLKGDRLLSLCDGGDTWAAERRQLVEELLREFGPLPHRPPPCDCGALWFNACFIAVADWLASD